MKYFYILLVAFVLACTSKSDQESKSDSIAVLTPIEKVRLQRSQEQYPQYENSINLNVHKGDILVCVDNGRLQFQDKPDSTTSYPPLRVGGEYVVQNVHVCECGDVSYDVGLYAKGSVSCECGALSSPKTHIWWSHSSRFVLRDSL